MSDEAQAARWDARYAGGAAPFGVAPSLFLRVVAARPDLRARSALMLADGDGRNGRWLAARGIATTALDLSPVATERARALDRAAGVAVARETADLRRWRREGRRWGLVALIGLHGPASLRAAALAAAREALAPEGWLALEGFAETAAPTLGPKPGLRWRLAEVEAATQGLRLLEALEGRVRLDEGPRHQGVAEMLRFLAASPG
jgi:hypothetical protein